MEKRGSFGEISNIMINETSEIIRDIDSKQGAPDEEAQKLKQELKLKEEVLLKKTEEFHFLQNSLEKENHSLKEEINKFKGFEELKEKYQNLDRKYNALEKDFITAKAILLININIFFILYLYSSIGHKMMGIQKN
jgi:acyl carrier protein phosphodiesterase